LPESSRSNGTAATMVNTRTAATTVNTNDGPGLKASDNTLILDDPHYIPPNQHDIFLRDIDSPLLHGALSTRLGARYLSEVTPAEQQERFEKKRIYGKLVNPNHRFVINLPCRRESRRDRTASPRAALAFCNVFFVVDTASPQSYLCAEAMEALVRRNGSPIPSCMDVELMTGNTMEFHLSPANSHFSGVNIIGGSILKMADVVSDLANDNFSLHFIY
jgi:hypothetical protein